MVYKDKEKQKKTQREYHVNNKDIKREKYNQRRAKRRAWFAEYKASLCCEICGENCSITLDFHHKDPAVKDTTVSSMLRTTYSVERILQEISKCAVLCSNCHRKLHAGLIELPGTGV